MNMNTKKLAYLLAFVLVFSSLMPTVSAFSEEENSRYFVATTKGFWKGTFGVRHNFDDGFTANLSDWQLRIAKIAGIEVYPVKQLSISPESFFSRFRAAQRSTPEERIPWGIDMMYDDVGYNGVGGADVSVAVLDTGVYKEHVDLKDRIKGCKDFTSAKQPIIDGKCEDKNGHGTHVAGIILADGGADDKGIYGMAPEAKLLAYKVCGTNGSCWSDDISIAIREAADNGAQIINLSLGSDSSSSLISDAIDYAVSKNVLIIAAAGNDGPYPSSIDYPAALPSVVAVGAIDLQKNVPNWSSQGNNSQTISYVVEEKDMEFAAPGLNIESTWKDGGYAVLSGTSMAAPHIAGLAAKVWRSDNLENPAKATREYLQTIFQDINALGDDNASGFGLPTL